MYLICTSHRTRRDESDPTKARPVLTTTASRRNASRATRSDQNGLGCQDMWIGINGASVELRATQAVRFGSVRFCWTRHGLQCEWRIRRLANPCTNVTYLICTSHKTRRDESTLSPHDNSDATGRVESDADRSQWIRLSGYVKRYKRCFRRPAHSSGGPIRFGSDRIGSGCSVNGA
jgi:hypothetical protein